MSTITRWLRGQKTRFDLWRLQIWYREGYRDGQAGSRDDARRPAQGPHRIAYLTGWADGWAEAGRPLAPTEQSDHGDR
jgi:hypothetical protein